MNRENNLSLNQKNIILFDGVCVLCSKSVDFLLRRDKYRKFRFLPLQSESAAEILRHYPKSKDAAEKLSSLIYLRNGKIKLRSDAVLAILSDLGSGYRLLNIFYLMPLPIRDWVYNQIAKRRYGWFGKCEMCRTVPDDEIYDSP